MSKVNHCRYWVSLGVALWSALRRLGILLSGSACVPICVSGVFSSLHSDCTPFGFELRSSQAASLRAWRTFREHGPGRGADSRRGREVCSWQAMDNSRFPADRAYDALSRAYPEAAKNGQFMGDDCSKNTVMSRFERLGSFLGSDVALLIVEKDPILLLGDTSMQEASFRYLRSLEEKSEEGLALDAVTKNPRLLTVPEFEYQRTKPTLASLAQAATAIDFLRPLGEVGLAVVIFGSFILLLLILRPLIYGVGGGQSLVGSITGAIPPIPKPWEIAESYGINLASLVAIIPIYQVVSAVRNQVSR
ncbi:unnamed protein product [Effrenium voratum]|nr:unnamed protein product [Effrenium voratum]